MMRAWLESATAGYAPTNREPNSRTKMEGISLREVIFTPLTGMRPTSIRRFEERAGYLAGALNYRLARGWWRQGETAGVHPVVYGCGCVSFILPRVGGQTCKCAQPTGEKQAQGEGKRADCCAR